MDASQIAQINLGLQIFLIILLLLSWTLKKKGKFYAHGSMMSIALVLNAVSFALVMVPSLRNLKDVIANYPLSHFSVIVVVHATLGSIAEILAIWLVSSWRLRSDTQHCASRKKIMLATFVLWMTALLLGILTYEYLWKNLQI